jgi:hypothetical protein
MIQVGIVVSSGAAAPPLAVRLANGGKPRLGGLREALVKNNAIRM